MAIIPGSESAGGGTKAQACSATTDAPRNRASSCAKRNAAAACSESSTPTTIVPAMGLA